MFFNDKEMKYIQFSVDLGDIIYFLCLIKNIYQIYNHNADWDFIRMDWKI